MHRFEATLNQALRLLIFESSNVDHAPIVFSSRFCKTQSTTIEPSIAWGIPFSNTSSGSQFIDASYKGRLMSPLGSRDVDLRITTEESGGKSVCFRVVRSRFEQCVQMTQRGEFLEFDSTSAEYSTLVRNIFVKKWPNHIIYFDNRTGLLHWKIGWNDVVFFRLQSHSEPKGVTLSQSQGVVGSGTWFCGTHKSFSFLRMNINYSSGTLELLYRKAYSLPWSTHSALVNVSIIGGGLWFDVMNANMLEFMEGVSGADSLDYIHLVRTPDNKGLLLTLSDSLSIKFSYC